MTTLTFALVNPRVEFTDGSNSLGLGVERVTIGYDRTWAPHVQVSLELVVPDPAALSRIDPRQGFRCRFTLTMDDLSGHTAATSYNLHFRRRDISWVAGTATATAVSDEAVWQDYAATDSSTWGYSDNQQGINIVAGAQGYGYGDKYVVIPGAPTIGLAAAATAADAEDYWAPGTSGWDYASQMAEAAGAWIYCDELGVFRYAPQGYAVDTTRRYFDETYNLIDVVDVIDRGDDAWGTVAMIGYTPADSAKTTWQVSYGTGSPPKMLVLQRQRKKPTNGNAAVRVRTGAQAAGRRLQLTSVADIACRPNQPATASYRGQSVSGVLEAVAFTFPEGTQQSVLAVTQ